MNDEKSESEDEKFRNNPSKKREKFLNSSKRLNNVILEEDGSAK